MSKIILSSEEERTIHHILTTNFQTLIDSPFGLGNDKITGKSRSFIADELVIRLNRENEYEHSI